MTPANVTRSIVCSTLLAASLLPLGCAEPIPDAAENAAPAATAAPAALATPAPGGGWSFSPADAGGPAGWHGIHSGIDVSKSENGDAMHIHYRRTKGKPAGVAFHLPHGASERLKNVVIEIAATPAQRLSICLTDQAGVVWTLPTVKAVDSYTTFTLAAGDLQPDPFQNQGKSIPAAPDWSSMQMLTILDITGFMGAPEADCTWRVRSVRGEEVER